MTTTSILNRELIDLLSEIKEIKHDTNRDYISEYTEELEVNAYSLRFKLRVKTERGYPYGIHQTKEVWDLEMIYTDDADHEVILTPTQHAYACKELENKILIIG